MKVVTIDVADRKDLPQISALLQEADLPTADIEPLVSSFLVARSNADLVGCIGLEVFASIGLLRSLAVASNSRNEGIAAKLCDTLLEHARKQGVERLYLLTTTARDYFRRHDFVEIDREDAPDAIRRHSQFTSLCPSSAVLMLRPVAQ